MSRMTLVSDTFSQKVPCSWEARLAEWRTWQLARGLSLRTVDERGRLMARFAHETKVDPETVGYAVIVEWMASHDSGGAAPWSIGTRRTYHSVLCAWFGWLMRMEYRASNPMIKVGTVRTPPGQPRPVADEHLPRLFATRMHRRTRAMILLAGYAGLRVHEIAKLRGEDIDPIARTLTVRGKGGKVRTLPAADALVTLAADMPRRGWWFPSRSPEGHVQARSVSAMIGQVMRRAGIPGTAHSLRHWYATTLVDEGTDLRTVQELLRHASLATTQIYTQVSDERRREAVSRLDMLRATHGAA